MAHGQSQGRKDHRDRTVALCCAALVVLMLGAAFASVPLYRLFCEATGFAGTPQRALHASDASIDKTITVRFDANVTPGMPWRFEPVQSTLDVKIGENALAFYRATNLADHAVTGMATFNVTPEPAGGFFNKIQCFCFAEQVLEPGQSVEMPVSFFIDPQIVSDRDGRSISLIVLSYTFYPVEGRAGLAGRAGDGAAGPARGTPAATRGTAG
ncbi:MAG TPA: cytochrome c oxidase assembly protein [Hyphomicrobiaceae bacterium]|nr:cytochrome c oxidase assembly protein [Hyphomicrobiaceae bacterium]